MNIERKNKIFNFVLILKNINDGRTNKVIASKNNFISLDEKIVLTKFIDVKKLYSEEIMKK